jgi:alpha-methylacyl-CoA racemase
VANLCADRFAARPLAYWMEVFADLDACVAPVLTLSEARIDDHLAARRVYVAVPGSASTVQPAAAPRFSGTPTSAGPPAQALARHTDEVLAELGLQR